MGQHSPVVRRRAHLSLAVAAVVAVTGLLAGCAGTASGGTSAKAASDTSTEVKVTLTSSGCALSPATIAAGHVDFAVANKNASAVSEAELRTKDLSHILGEQENLTPGLSGGFSLNIQPGSYVINCPGATKPHSTLTVTGKSSGTWESNAQLTAAVKGYSGYVATQVAGLISSTQTFCSAIDAGDMAQAQTLYSPARLAYERIEPVAEIWGSLDVSIDGRWHNPVTKVSEFTGFHRIEQLMFEDKTLDGASALCSGLVANEQHLQTLVKSAQYSPLEMAAGATDLINEAATAKISGEEERYSNVDLPTFAANVEGAQEVVELLTPYLSTHDQSTLSTIQTRYSAVMDSLATYNATPGYLNTGYVDYSSVTSAQRKSLSSVVNAYSEALSKMSSEVS